jgi:hypothetical protein
MSTTSAATTHGLTTADRKALTELPATYERKLDVSVVALLQEAQQLAAALVKLGDALVERTLVAADAATQLDRRRQRLESAELDWKAVGSRVTPAAIVELRAQAQLRKRDAVEALRYFGRDNQELQQVIESISRRVGDAELVLELHTLAQAVEDNAAILRHADLPKGAAEQLRALADELDTQLAKHRVRSDASSALALRNRAFWHLRELLEEIREAGRYVFRNDARALALFRSSAARTRARQRANKASKTQDSEPPGSSPNQTPSGWGSSGS